MGTTELITLTANVFGVVVGGGLGGAATAVVTVLLQRRRDGNAGGGGRVALLLSLGVGALVGAGVLAWLSGLVWIVGIGVVLVVPMAVGAWLRNRRRPLLEPEVLVQAEGLARQASRNDTDYVFDNDPGVWLDRVYTVQQVRPTVDKGQTEPRTDERRLTSVQLLAGAGG